MKTFILLACVAVACAWPVQRDDRNPKGGDVYNSSRPQGEDRRPIAGDSRPQGEDRRNKSGERRPQGEDRHPHSGERPEGDNAMAPKMPEGPIEPLTGADLLGLMSDVKDFADEARSKFVQLQADANDIDGSESSLSELGEKTKHMLADLQEMGGERAGQLGEQWMNKMMRLVFAGVEDEGQCHKVLEHLMGYLKEAEEKRQLGEDELAFWEGVIGAAREEVGCIINRFGEFEGMISHVENAINNPPAGYDEEGHAFEAEVLMGSLYFGFGHLYRQVAVFTHVMSELMSHEEAADDGSRSINQLRALLQQAEGLQSRMDKMRSLRKFGQKAMF